MTDRCWRLAECVFLIWDEQVGQYAEVGPDVPKLYSELPPGAVELTPGASADAVEHATYVAKLNGWRND